MTTHQSTYNPVNAYPAFKFSNSPPRIFQPDKSRARCKCRQNLERERRRTSKDLRAMGTGASRTLGKKSRMKALVLSASASRSARIVPLLLIFITP
jgi:hypothetical protein